MQNKNNIVLLAVSLLYMQVVSLKIIIMVENAKIVSVVNYLSNNNTRAV